MGIFSRNKNGGVFADVIRCDEPDYLIWKWHPAGANGTENSRESAIRWGSILRVKEGSVAVFVYNQKKGVFQDFVEGPFEEKITTKNFPILTELLGAMFDGNTPFQAEVFFINVAKIIQSKFAVPYFDVFDPRFKDFGVPVAVRGTITYKIKDYREFIKLHRLEAFSKDEFERQVRDAVVRYTKACVSNIPDKNELPVLRLEQKISYINEVVLNEIQERFAEEFGVVVSSVDISTVEIDRSSEGYKRLKSVTQDIDYAITAAKAEAEIKNIHDKQRVEMEDYEGRLRLEREESQYAKHKQTQTINIGAYQTEKQAEVGVAGAEALGKMGANGAGNVDLGSGAAGFNPASMMASMALGGVVGQNMANTMSNAFNMGAGSVVTPPPIPTVAFYVASNGTPTGPFDLQTLTQMASGGTFGKETMVWKNGMPEWVKAGSVEELKSVLANVMPPIPRQD